MSVPCAARSRATFQPARIGQPVADLVEGDDAIKGLHDPFGLRNAGQIQPDDQPRAGQLSILFDNRRARSMSVVHTRSIIVCTRSSFEITVRGRRRHRPGPRSIEA